MRVVFMGTPDFAVLSLKALVEAGYEVCSVFTQPDKPVGRHQNRFQPTPVKEYALTQNIPVYQPANLRDGEALAILKELDPELIVVAAYGRILPPDILAQPRLGCINVHSSLLPKYRGAAPINWAILNGEDETGVTIMYMAEGMDTGDILAQSKTSIDLNENAVQLFDRLALLGAELLVQTIKELETGTAKTVSQDDSQSSYAPMLSRELSPMDWEKTVQQLHDQVRGLYPWPAATAELDGVRCKILRTVILDKQTGEAPGTVLQAGKRGLHIACGGGGVLEITEIQPDGKKAMSAASFLMGHPIKAGSSVRQG